MAGRTVVVTGVSGFVGQVLLPYLERDSSVGRVIGVDFRPPANDATFNKLTFHQLDVRDPRLEDLLSGVDVLVHLAFVMLPTRKQKKAKVESINIQGTQAVCQAAARQGVRKLVILSSVMAYGLHPDNPIPLTEEMPLRPNRGVSYGWAKSVNEWFLDTFVTEHPEMVVTRLRPCTIVGPHGMPGQMLPLVSDPVLMVRGADPAYQLLYEDDLARALHLVIQEDVPGVYNVASDEPETMTELARAHGGQTRALPYFVFRNLLGLMWWLGYSALSAEWADMARYPLLVSNSKLKARGWQPQYTTAQAYAALWAAFNREGIE